MQQISHPSSLASVVKRRLLFRPIIADPLIRPQRRAE